MPSKALITTEEVSNLDPSTLRSPLECAQYIVRLDSLIIELDSRLAYAEADDQDRAAGRTPSDQRYEPRSASWRVRAKSARDWTALTRDRVALRKLELESATQRKLAAIAAQLRIMAEESDRTTLGLSVRVSGAAGTGKTPLAHLLRAAIADRPTGVPFAPVVEVQTSSTWGDQARQLADQIAELVV